MTISSSVDSRWVSVASDDFNFVSEDRIKSVIEPLFELFHTDLIAVACDDSDYMFVNNLNKAEGIDGWVNIGSHHGIKNIRRNSLAQ